MFPVSPVGNGLGEGAFALLVEVAHGPVAGGQSLLPCSAVAGTGLAGGGGFGGGADRAQTSVEGAEPGQPQFLGDMRGCLGGLGGVGVADEPQSAVGHGTDV